MAVLRATDISEAIAVAQDCGDTKVAAALNAAMRTKASVDAATPSNTPELIAQGVYSEFEAMVAKETILGQLREKRSVPFDTPIPIQLGSGASYWVKAGNPIPAVQTNWTTTSLAMLKIASLCVFSDAVLRLSDAAEFVQRALTTTSAESLDGAFINPIYAAVADTNPASVTHGVTPTVSSGNPLDDIRALIDGFAGDLRTSSLVTDSTTASQLALFTDSGGSIIFADCGPRGGSVITLPLIASASSPRDSTGGQIVLLDAAGILVADDGISIDTSLISDVMMSDSPTQPAAMVSLFQTNSGALRLIHRVNWAVARTGAVAMVTGASY
jgi:hypothetical protein